MSHHVGKPVDGRSEDLLRGMYHEPIKKEAGLNDRESCIHATIARNGHVFEQVLNLVMVVSCGYQPPHPNTLNNSRL